MPTSDAHRYSVYVAGPLGFTDPGRTYLYDVLLPELTAHDFHPLDPWGGASNNPETVGQLDHIQLDDLREKNKQLGSMNERMIRDCWSILAILDGSDVDSGTASEIGFAAALGKRVAGVRTDFRLAGDNSAVEVNLQLAHFITSNGGEIVRSLRAAIDVLAHWRTSHPRRA